MGTAHAGPITHSRKKNDEAKKRIERNVSGVSAAGITNALARMNELNQVKAGRAYLPFPVFATLSAHGVRRAFMWMFIPVLDPGYAVDNAMYL